MTAERISPDFRFQARAVEQTDGTWTLFTVVTLSTGDQRHDQWPGFKTRHAALLFGTTAQADIKKAIEARHPGRAGVTVNMKGGGQA